MREEAEGARVSPTRGGSARSRSPRCSGGGSGLMRGRPGGVAGEESVFIHRLGTFSNPRPSHASLRNTPTYIGVEHLGVDGVHAQPPQQLRALVLVEVVARDEHARGRCGRRRRCCSPRLRAPAAAHRGGRRREGGADEGLNLCGQGPLAAAVVQEDLAGPELHQQVERLCVCMCLEMFA